MADPMAGLAVMSSSIAGDRTARLRRRRAMGASTRQLGREFGITQTQVLRILAATGGDPLASGLERLTLADLERERERLRDRIASDRRRLRVVIDELEVRRTDRILGLPG